jgi:hypothetical protein
MAMQWESCIDEIKNPEVTTDAAFVVLLSLISHIEKTVPKDYKVIHDTSNNLKKYNEVLMKLISYDSLAEFKHTAITTIKFPLKISSVMQVNSKASNGVQLADVLIGGLIEHSMSLAGLVNKNDYNQSIPELYSDHNIIHLLPNVNFEQLNEFHSGSQANDFVNFYGKNFS